MMRKEEPVIGFRLLLRAIPEKSRKVITRCCGISGMQHQRPTFAVICLLDRTLALTLTLVTRKVLFCLLSDGR